jgi:peptidoglycan/xylan/chitin deacetylase (PgdA/CDA1 family)
MNPSPLLRKAVKLAALPWGMVSRRRPGDVVVLLYHRVGAGDREIDLPDEMFDRHVSYLAGHERVLSLDEALIGDGSGGVVVTVDDGFRDFHEHVLPTLVHHQVPALLYLATGLVSNGKRGAPVSDDALTWQQLREAVGTGLVRIGSHTHTHADLSTADERVAEEEMRRSKELIEDRLGIPCIHFAYPFAVGSPAADRVARRVFETIAVGAWRTNRRQRIDPYRLGRTPVLRGDDGAFFSAKVRGLLDGERLAYRLTRRGPWRRG